MLMTDDTNTPSPIADGARHTGQEAAQTMRGWANEAQAEGANTGRDALNTAKGLFKDAQGVTGDAWDVARTYAKYASDIAGDKLGDLKAKASELQGTASRQIANEPIKAVALGAAAGALLAALVMRRGRGPREL